MDGRDSLVGRLLEHARRGDGAALGELLNIHRDRLREIAVRLLDPRMGARLDASDLVQQTCLSVHKRISEFHGNDPAQFAAWLRQIHERNLQNAIRDHLQADKRAAGRERSLEGREAGTPDDSSPSRRAMRSERDVRVAEAIGRLPDDEREALRLRYVEGLPLAEVAERTGLTRDALLWLMKRALKRVRSYLPRDGF